MKYLFLVLLIQGCTVSLVDHTDKTQYVPMQADVARRCLQICKDTAWEATELENGGQKFKCICREVTEEKK
jgi:hypothetical protein